MTNSFPQISFQKSPQVNQKHFEYRDLSTLFPYLKTIEDHDPARLHRLDFYVLLFNFGKSLQHKVDFQEYTLQQGEAMLISPGQVHAFVLNQPASGGIILCTEYFMTQYIPPAALEQIKPLFNYFLGIRSMVAPSRHHKFLRNIADCLQAPTAADSEILAGLRMTELLLSWVNAEQEGNLSNLADYAAFERFRKSVETHYPESRDAQYYARLMGYTYKKLNDLCARVVSQTPKHFIDLMVILSVKRRLVASSTPIKQLAYETGFDSPTNFAKYFKKHTGITPKQFLLDLQD